MKHNEQNELEPLTPEMLRTYKGWENVSDQQAERVIKDLERFATITYSIFHQRNNKGHENKH